MKNILLLAVASLTIATGASAQTGTATAAKATVAAKLATPAKPVVAAKIPTVAKPALTAPAVKPVTLAKPAPAAPAPVAKAGNLVTTTTKTGKKVTYDCSKKGNLNKTACKI